MLCYEATPASPVARGQPTLIIGPVPGGADLFDLMLEMESTHGPLKAFRIFEHKSFGKKQTDEKEETHTPAAASS